MALDQGPRSPRSWHIAQLKPGGLGRAAENLARQGIATFMPLREVTRRRSGRLERRVRPIFPGYLFLQVPPGARPWRSINATYGVARLVAFAGETPAEVPEALMEGLFARVGPGELLLPPDDFRAGDRVRIVAGPFATLLAEIEAMPEQGRIFALLDIMGRCVRTEVTPAQVERL
jgi:transcriptional antiterminator RfaH